MNNVIQALLTIRRTCMKLELPKNFDHIYELSTKNVTVVKFTKKKKN